MKAYGTEGITYSEKYFSEENIARLMQMSEIKRTIKAAKPTKKTPRTVEHTPESAYETVWQEMMQDANLQQLAEQEGVTKEFGTADFAMRIAAPLPTDTDEELTESLAEDYVVTVEEGKFVHYLKGEVILSIPEGIKSAAEKSTDAQTILLGVLTFIDAVMVICAICKIRITVDKGTLANSLQEPLTKFILFLGSDFFIYELGRMQSQVDRMLYLLEKFYYSEDVDKNVIIQIYLGELKGLNLLLAIGSVIAAIFTTVCSGGASIVVQILFLVGAIGVFVSDLSKFIEALGYEPLESVPMAPPTPTVPPPTNCYYIGNNNTMEIHNSCRIMLSCKYGMIRPDHKVFFKSIQEVEDAIEHMDYNGCAHCMPEYDTG